MRDSYWYIGLTFSLAALSAVTYFLQIQIFNNPRDTFFYLFQDLAFVPMQVLIVTIILDRLLKKREKQTLIHKLNMVIGMFFYEIGSGLLEHLNRSAEVLADISHHLDIKAQWTDRDFFEAARFFRKYDFKISYSPEHFSEVREFLILKRPHLMTLLENPNLLEHETFTDLLWAVFHFTDELSRRDSFIGLPETDTQHLLKDALRVYGLLVAEWLVYMKHLKKDYPYLFSLALRTNPFNPERDIVVR